MAFPLPTMSIDGLRDEVIKHLIITDCDALICAVVSTRGTTSQHKLRIKSRRKTDIMKVLMCVMTNVDDMLLSFSQRQLLYLADWNNASSAAPCPRFSGMRLLTTSHEDYIFFRSSKDFYSVRKNGYMCSSCMKRTSGIIVGCGYCHSSGFALCCGSYISSTRCYSRLLQHGGIYGT